MFTGEQNNNFFAWWLLTLVAVTFIVMGIQGSAGRVLAVALVPRKLIVDTSTPNGAQGGVFSF